MSCKSPTITLSSQEEVGWLRNEGGLAISMGLGAEHPRSSWGGPFNLSEARGDSLKFLLSLKIEAKRKSETSVFAQKFDSVLWGSHYLGS